MARSSVSADMLHLSLKQLGATKIQSSTSRVAVVKFEINPELTVSYFYYIKDEEKIYLQRIEPYPVRNYRFETVENIISFIKKDVEQFENASKSSNFKLFLEIIHTNYEVRRELEELFLLNNVPHEMLEDVLKEEKEVLEQIKNTEHIALKNDPGRYPGEEAELQNIFDSNIEMAPSAVNNASELYGETSAPHPSIIASIVKDAIASYMEEMKQELKEELREEFKEMKK